MFRRKKIRAVEGQISIFSMLASADTVSPVLKQPEEKPLLKGTAVCLTWPALLKPRAI